MKDIINRIKTIMTAVSTGQAQIQELNEEYQRLYEDLDLMLESRNTANPNPHADLWEFYEYWKENLPSWASRRAYISKIYKNIKVHRHTLKRQKEGQGYSYVNLERIKELKNIQNKQFDFKILIELCEELNKSFVGESYLACGMLVRSILNHVPPIFNCNNFNEVSNNHGSKSFKESMNNLQSSSRKIADSYLHNTIRQKEILPTPNQVDFSNDLDVLLGEIIRITK